LIQVGYRSFGKTLKRSQGEFRQSSRNVFKLKHNSLRIETRLSCPCFTYTINSARSPDAKDRCTAVVLIHACLMWSSVAKDFPILAKHAHERTVFHGARDGWGSCNRGPTREIWKISAWEVAPEVGEFRAGTRNSLFR